MKNNFRIVCFLLVIISLAGVTSYIKLLQRDYALEKEQVVLLNEAIKGKNSEIEDLKEQLVSKRSEVDLLSRQVGSIKLYYLEKQENSVMKEYYHTSNSLSESQLQVANEIAYIVASEYDTYGVLPSVAVGQAMQETGLGGASTSASNNYGYWGVCSSSGYATYSSLYEGVISYLRCINNGLYDGALFEKDYSNSLYAIQNGGYCVPSEGYASKVINCIEKYNFKAYDDYYLGGEFND